MRHLLLAGVLVACNRGEPPTRGARSAPPPAPSAPAVEAGTASLPQDADATPAAFFPPHTFSDATEKLTVDWYGKQLRAMGEPSLWAAALAGKTAVRFLWLRTWGRPIAVRVDVDGGLARLVATRLTGDGGYRPGKIDVQRSRALTAAEWEEVERALAAATFDTMPAQAEAGLDGAQWILERAKGGTYHLVDRWSPLGRYAAFAHACQVLLDLAGRDLVYGDVY